MRIGIARSTLDMYVLFSILTTKLLYSLIDISWIPTTLDFAPGLSSTPPKMLCPSPSRSARPQFRSRRRGRSRRTAELLLRWPCSSMEPGIKHSGDLDQNQQRVPNEEVWSSLEDPCLL